MFDESIDQHNISPNISIITPMNISNFKSEAEAKEMSI